MVYYYVINLIMKKLIKNLKYCKMCTKDSRQISCNIYSNVFDYKVKEFSILENEINIEISLYKIKKFNININFINNTYTNSIEDKKTGDKIILDSICDICKSYAQSNYIYIDSAIFNDCINRRFEITEEIYYLNYEDEEFKVIMGLYCSEEYCYFSKSINGCWSKGFTIEPIKDLSNSKKLTKMFNIYLTFS